LVSGIGYRVSGIGSVTDAARIGGCLESASAWIRGGSGADSGTDSALYKHSEAASKRGRQPGLMLLDPEAGDEPEVAEIDGQDREAKLQRRDAEQQVGEGDGHALGLLLSVDLCGQQSGRLGVWMDRQIAQ
jgi:hypothetical protein